MQLTDLPYDLLVQVIELLVKDGGRTVTRTLARTSATCRELHDLVESIGWRAYYLDQMGALALNNNFEPLTLDPTDPGCPGTWRDLARDHGKFAQTWLAHPWSPGYDTYVYHSFGCHQPGGPDLPSEIFSSKESYGGDQRYFAVMTSHEQHGEIVYGIHMLDLECMVWTGLVRLKESELPDPEQFHGARSLFLSYVWDDGSAVLVCSVIDELHVWIMKVSMETGLTDTFRGFPNSTAHPVASGTLFSISHGMLCSHANICARLYRQRDPRQAPPPPADVPVHSHRNRHRAPPQGRSAARVQSACSLQGRDGGLDRAHTSSCHCHPGGSVCKRPDL
ncbi:hypothetical protein BC828DRAFT_382897 [Blastocladiella britannica]|nr:hypothetical protein BC828DRAFT_382897 [Blastocladiella britannica]